MGKWPTQPLHARVEEPVNNGYEEDDNDGVEGVESRCRNSDAACSNVHSLALEDERRGHLAMVDKQQQ